MKITSETVESLSEMGFTDLEARIYACLLQDSPATGYRIAKEIGGTNASIYKALEALQAKGAVLVDDARTRQCRAVPFEELFEQMERRFKARRTRATRALKTLSPAEHDDRIYQLATADQVFGKCRSMLREAERVVLLDLFPRPLDELSSDVEAAAARVPRVLVQTYRPVSLEGAEVQLHRMGGQVLERWPVQWLFVTVDGAQSLVAALDAGEGTVHQALWTASPVLSWALMSYAMAEFELASLVRSLADEGGHEARLAEHEAWRKARFDTEIPGFRSLVERFGGAPGGER